MWGCHSLQADDDGENRRGKEEEKRELGAKRSRMQVMAAWRTLVWLLLCPMSPIISVNLSACASIKCALLYMLLVYCAGRATRL